MTDITHMANEKEAEKQLIQFIRAHHHHMTVADIAVEMNVNYNHVRHLCTRLKIECCTINQQQKAFLMEYHAVKTVSQLAKCLQINDYRVISLCSELGISPKKPVVAVKEVRAKRSSKPTTSVAQILGQFQMVDANHHDCRKYVHVEDLFKERK